MPALFIDHNCRKYYNDTNLKYRKDEATLCSMDAASLPAPSAIERGGYWPLPVSAGSLRAVKSDRRPGDPMLR